MITAGRKEKEAVPNARASGVIVSLPSDEPVLKNQTPPVIFDEKDDDVDFLPPISLPSEHRSISEFITTGITQPPTNHTVTQIIDEETHKTYYLKYTKKAENAYLEAAMAGEYRMYAPHNIMPSHVINDGNKCIGVASEAFPGFKSLAVDKLKPFDLNYAYLGQTPEEHEKNIEILEKLDDEFQTLVDEENIIAMKFAQLEDEEKELRKKIHEVGHQDQEYCFIALESSPKEKQTNQMLGHEHIAVLENLPKDDSRQEEVRLAKKIESIPNKRKKLLKEEYALSKKFKHFNHTMRRDYQFTREEFDRYRLIKTITNVLATSMINMEDDLHQNNLGKKGRYDFDMSGELAIDSKEKGLRDNYFRAPGVHLTIVHPDDIENFPNTDHFKPYYWPTSQTKSGSISSTTGGSLRTVKAALGFADNDFEISTNELFQRIKTHPVCIYHKYVNFTKCMLKTDDLTRQNAVKHIPQDVEYTFKNKVNYLINHFEKQQNSRPPAYYKAFLVLPKFQEWFKKNHEKVSAKFLKELSKQNLNYIDRAAGDTRDLSEYKETPNDATLSAIHIKRKCDTILLEVNNKIINASTNYEKLMKMIQEKLVPFSSESMLSALFGGYGMFTKAPPSEAKMTVERIIKEADTLPDFIRTNKDTMGAQSYLTAIKKIFDIVKTETELCNEKPELLCLRKELLLFQEFLKNALPVEMLSNMPTPSMSVTTTLTA